MRLRCMLHTLSASAHVQTHITVFIFWCFLYTSVSSMAAHNCAYAFVYVHPLTCVNTYDGGMLQGETVVVSVEGDNEADSDDEAIHPHPVRGLESTFIFGVVHECNDLVVKTAISASR